jgi:hypothetical protein
VNTIVIGIAVTAALSACGGAGSSDRAAPRPRATVTVTVTASPNGPATTELPPPIVGQVRRLAQITSPSHNIQCSLDRGVDCVIEESDYEDLPEPTDCQVDWTDHRFIIGDHGGVRGVCTGEPPLTEVPDVLPYGVTTVWKTQVCQSQETGMTCWDTRTGHGFRIARASYTLF